MRWPSPKPSPLPRLRAPRALSAALALEATGRLLEELPRLTKQEPRLASDCSRARFVPDGARGKKRASELYDPTDKELLALLSEVTS